MISVGTLPGNLREKDEDAVGFPLERAACVCVAASARTTGKANWKITAIQALRIECLVKGMIQCLFLFLDFLRSFTDMADGLFCVSDILALSVISVAQESGLSVPEDITVTGFDDVDYTTMVHPYLTTVAQPCYEMGRHSVSMVLDILQKPAEAERGRRFLEHRLVCRESAAGPKNK